MEPFNIIAGDQLFGLSNSTSLSGMESIALPDVEKSTILFQIPYELAKCTITPVSNGEGGITYHALLYGVIGTAKDYMSLFRICTKSSENDLIKVYVDSVGGDITTAIAIHNALNGTKARVEKIALGDVMSAATLIVDCIDSPDGRKTCTVGKYAHFMYHMSASGGFGNTTVIIETSQHLFGYIVDYLKEAVKRKCITTDEFDMIVNKRQDVFITAKNMAERLNKQII